MIFGLFGDKTAREAKQLNKDAPLIIEQAEQIYVPARLREMAEMIVEHLEKTRAQYGTEVIDLQRAHYDFRGLHKEARRRNDQIALSAMTLVIIHLRARIAGPQAEPARAAIDAFTEAWLHDGTASGADGVPEPGNR